MTEPDPFPIVVEMPDCRGHRVYWRLDRSQQDYENDLILAAEDICWGPGH